MLVQADRLVGGKDAVLVIDDTAMAKKGERSGSSASGGRPGSKNTMCRTCRPMPLSRRSLPRSRPGGSVNRPTSSSRRSLGSTTSKAWTGLHRHALMTMIAYAFLQSRRLKAAGRKKKESQDRHHNQACRPSGKRSSTSSRDLHPDNVLTVTGSLHISPNQKCQSSARVQTH